MPSPRWLQLHSYCQTILTMLQPAGGARGWGPSLSKSTPLIDEHHARDREAAFLETHHGIFVAQTGKVFIVRLEDFHDYQQPCFTTSRSRPRERSIMAE
jgi:hypothetical protein